MSDDKMSWDVIVVGAGPAGMAAAVEMAKSGLHLSVIDEQPLPGGQIWRSIERRGDDRVGVEAVRRFRSSGVNYMPETRLWQLEALPEGRGWRIFLARDGHAFWCECRALLLATGAYERPQPLSDWTLPGVLMVGAAQILLKTSSQLPDGATWVAGAGPLTLLYMSQVLKKGGKIAGYLNTGSHIDWIGLLPSLCRAIRGDPVGLARGLSWQLKLRLSRVPVWNGVSQIEALADAAGDKLAEVSFTDARGQRQRMPASTLLLHNGLLPVTDAGRAAQCVHCWLPSQGGYAPLTDEWSMSSEAGLFFAGDGTGIAGADAAVLKGELAAIGISRWICEKDDRPTSDHLAKAAAIRNRLRKLEGRQKFIDALYPPPNAGAADNDVIICRCEEVRAETLRAVIREFPDGGPNEIKIKTRCGMGACQGRQCGDALLRIFATERNMRPDEIEALRVRPPIRPLTMAELASLEPLESVLGSEASPKEPVL